ncbi:hypothetical protein GF318_05850, partial [Candidatus Micrarchaeota archaeon]|nr:hypothetical protein [Candidatus Micrarchaeota archaeon]
MNSHISLLVAVFLVLAGCTGEQACPAIYEPVCGEDGKNYDSACFARKANVSVAHEGRCSTAPPESCDDSDGGKDIFSSGSVLVDGHMTDDFCKDKETVREYFCRAAIKEHEDLPCPDGYVCENGACVPTPCEDSDGGIEPGEKGTATSASEEGTDSCEQNGSLKEYYCDGEDLAFKYIECQEEEHCVDGACIEYQCEDSDGGKEKTEKGTTTYMEESGTDVCYNSTAVTEYFCENNQIASEDLACSQGKICENGRCVEGPACMDSDSGKDKYTKGTVTVDGEDYDDECYDEDEVIEYYCDGDDPQSDKMSCGTDHECMMGKCVPIECQQEVDEFEEDDVRYSMESYDSETLRLYVNDAVEIEDGMMLELSDVDGNESTFKLYMDYSDYQDNDDECSETIQEGNSSSDLCGEDTGDIEVDVVDDADDYVEFTIDEFIVVEYYSGEGEDVEYFGYACDDEGMRVYAELEIYFYPYIDTDSGGLDLDGATFKFFGESATVEDIDSSDKTFDFELDGKDYQLEDGEDFEYEDLDYE